MQVPAHVRTELSATPAARTLPGFEVNGGADTLTTMDHAKLTLPIEQRFANYEQLTVRQKKRWLEILTSFEVKNTYEVLERGVPVLRVREQGSGLWSLIKRLFLGPMRPLHVLVSDIGSGEPLVELRRPFRFFFHRIEVSAIGGTALGAVQKRWSWIRRIY